MFEMTSVLAAFGGGILGALFGALPAFIFTGFLALIGIAVLAGGGSADILNLAFGPLLGPHVTFGAGVAAAAYAAKKSLLESGTDILTPLNKTGDVGVLLVGGVFGLLAHFINAAFVSISLPTDTVALTVVVSGIMARFVFGKTGLLGHDAPAKNEVAAGAEGTGRSYFPDAKSLFFIIIYSLGLGLVFSYAVDITQINVLGFGISAASLIFAQMGFPMPATHHVTLIAGVGTLVTGNLFIGTAFAVLSGVLCDLAGRIFNSHCDTHIDPPAVAIFICSFILLGLF